MARIGRTAKQGATIRVASLFRETEMKTKNFSDQSVGKEGCHKSGIVKLNVFEQKLGHTRIHNPLDREIVQHSGY